MAEEQVEQLNEDETRVRYCVVGLGHISQNAVLPAFLHAGGNSHLTSFVSDDPEKIAELCVLYNVEHAWPYDRYEEALRSGAFDAIYIALPNDMHKEFAIKAARAGIHILCEKPMAVTEDDCREMIEESRKHSVKLMIAYRLHFEKANITAIRLIESGAIGEPRIFNSVFCRQVKPGNIRTKGEKAGGPLYDLGIYCINAARYLFKAEPIRAMATTAAGKDSRFSTIEEMTSAILEFPDNRIATFTCSMGATSTGNYTVIGTEGSITLENSYTYSDESKLKTTIGDQDEEINFDKSDQFAPELLYFSDCILNNTEPEPSGKEGLLDVKIIQAIYASARTGRAVDIEAAPKIKRPERSQEMNIPPVKPVPLVNVEPPNF